jgi:CheY-like chemotaxis protein
VKRIAVVDDNAVNRRLVRALVKGHFEIDEYATGREALEGITRRPPDLVLLDISLPEMDGLEVLRRLREDPGVGIPLIAMTAHALVGDRERFLAAGFDDYVSKPMVDLKAVLEMIKGHLDAPGGS